jgi:hypothetical protein
MSPDRVDAVLLLAIATATEIGGIHDPHVVLGILEDVPERDAELWQLFVEALCWAEIGFGRLALQRTALALAERLAG